MSLMERDICPLEGIFDQIKGDFGQLDQVMPILLLSGWSICNRAVNIEVEYQFRVFRIAGE